MESSPARSAAVWGDPTGRPTEFDPILVKSLPACGEVPGWGAPSLVYSSFVPQRLPLVKGAKILAHVADRAGTHFTRLLAGDKVGVELASSDRSRGRIREIWR